MILPGVILSLFFCSSPLESFERPVIEIYLLKTRIESLQEFREMAEKKVACHFFAKESDLAGSAFIKDTEIIWYDTALNKIEFTHSAVEKIIEIDPPVNDGVQFVLTINRRPALCGYFINKHTSQPVMSYSISNQDENIKMIYKWIPFTLYSKLDERKNIELVNAFKASSRLK